jgi:hypothetical protein
VIIADMRSSMVAARSAAAIACAHDFGLDSCSRSEQLSGGVASTPLNVTRKRLTKAWQEIILARSACRYWKG